MAAPSWREFEKLVTRVEQVLAGGAVAVKSPDRIRSKITGRMREVDASLRVRIGSADILVTIECRRRAATQDVTWLEQLGNKKQAIGAARTIAVSSTAFSSDAIKAAAFYGLDLRLLAEITDAEVRDWILPQFVVHLYKSCEPIEPPEIVFEQASDDDFGEGSPMLEAGGFDSKDFSTSDGTRLSMNDLWLRIDDQTKIFETVPTDDKAYVRRIAVKLSDDLLLDTRLGPRRVKEIRLALSLRWKHEQIPLADAKVVLYSPANSTDGMETQVRAEFESANAPHMNIRLGIQFVPGASEATFTVEPLPAKK